MSTFPPSGVGGTFPPASSGGGGSTAWASITGKPSTFPPETHSHAISDVTGLQTALDGKADAGAAGASPIISWVI